MHRPTILNKLILIVVLLVLVLTVRPALKAQTINATVAPAFMLVTNDEGWGASLCWWGMPLQYD
jgi:hypothetical protein